MHNRPPRRRGHALTALTWASLAGALLAVAGFASRSSPPIAAVRIVESVETTVPALPVASAATSLSLAPDTGANGWYARYTPPGAARGARPAGEVRAYSPNAAFALDVGQGIAPGVPIDEFVATYDATITIPAAGKYRFGAEVEGGKLAISVFGGVLRTPVTLEVASGGGDARMTRWIDLQPGSINLQYTFTRAKNAKSRLRPMWERQGIGKNGFRLEAIPHDAVKPLGIGAADIKTWLSAQHGRVLLGELGCVSCHSGPGVETVTLPREAPLLGGMASRINPDWAKKWMTAPQSLKPGSGMPNVLIGENRAIDGDNITQFLLSTGGNFEVEHVATEPAGVELGRRTYTSLGCVACHGVPNDRTVKAEEPLTNLAGKWNATALSEFLQNPLKTHPAGRMPSHNLNAQEGDLIATYLINAWGKDNLNPGKPLQTDLKKAADLGRQAFASMGCANCHQVGGDTPPVVSTLKAKPIAQLNTKNGCLSTSDTKTPRYQLPADDRAALAAAIMQIQGWKLPAADAKQPVYPIDHTALTFNALGCRNCHEYNGSGGIDATLNPLFVTLAETDLGDEGRLPPRLDGVGGKLNSQWLTQVLTEGARARPYMAARMPVFGKAHTEGLVPLLAQSEGIWPGTDAQEPKIDDAQTQAGRRLVGDKGLNCISCHVVGNNPAAGTPGPDITAFASRLRYEWWADYIHAPVRFKPGTRMPAFFESGASNVTDVLSGDPDLQSDAMWAYFTLGEFAPAPDGLIPQGGFKVQVLNRPTVLRTFLRDAGSRGIAVGFPNSMGGVHFAFDAEKIRLVEAWKGDFLDASGAWAGRGGNVVGGQGPGYWKAPAGAPIVIAAEQPKEWPTASGRDTGAAFRGYQIDDKGVPTFMYTLAGNVEVTERFEPTPDGQIKRTFTLAGLGANATVWINTGPKSTLDKAVQNAATSGGEPDKGVFGFKATDASKPMTVTVVSKP